jgi:hypothetical protein
MQASQVRNICFALIAMLCVGAISLRADAQPDPETAIVYVNIDREWPSNDPEDGESWETAYRFLQDGLDKAEFLEGNPQISTVEIWVAQGKYRPDQGVNYTLGDPGASFALRNNVGIYGGFDGTESELEFDERDWELNPTILDGDLDENDDVKIYDSETGELVLELNNYSDNSYAVVTAQSTVVLPVDPISGFDCEACWGPSPDVCSCRFVDFNGQVISSLRDCNACPNHCDLNECSADPNCEGTTINNTAVLDGFHIRGANVEQMKLDIGFFGGGALRIVGASPTIRNCIIRENRNNSNDVHGVGVAIALPVPQQITMQNVTVQHNRAHRDGQGNELVAGIWIGDRCLVPSVHPTVLPRKVVLLGVKIAENIGTDNQTEMLPTGGGLYIGHSDPVLITDQNVLEVTVVNSTIHKNIKLGDGAGIYVGNRSELRLWNSLLHRNEAKQVLGLGGSGTAAIYKNSEGAVEIINSTIADNHGAEDGGLHLNVDSGEPEVIVKNSIFWGNTCDTPPPPQSDYPTLF